MLLDITVTLPVISKTLSAVLHQPPQLEFTWLLLMEIMSLNAQLQLPTVLKKMPQEFAQHASLDTARVVTQSPVYPQLLSMLLVLLAPMELTTELLPAQPVQTDSSSTTELVSLAQLIARPVQVLPFVPLVMTMLLTLELEESLPAHCVDLDLL